MGTRGRSAGKWLAKTHIGSFGYTEVMMDYLDGEDRPQRATFGVLPVDRL